MPDERADKENDLPVELPVRRRGAPWLLGGLVLALLFVLIAQQVLGLWEYVAPDTATDTLTLYALSSLNFVAFIVFAFIFVRNLLKLRRERRARILGSKIKTRLIVYFITVSLLPITAMAVFSYLFLTRSLEKWFGRIPEAVVEEARLARKEDATQQAQALHETARMAALALPQQTTADVLPPTLDQLLAQGNFAAVALAAPEGIADDALRFRPGVEFGRSKELAGALKTALWRVQQHDAAGGLPFTPAEGLIADAVPLSDGRTLLVARESTTDARLNKIVASTENFDHLRKRQRKVRMLGLSTLGLLTLLLLFAATWAAIHLARGIGTPIRALAEAADEVAQGNLSHRITALAEDEFAVLAGSFNQMTAQLEENRRRIEAGAGELREKNLALAERRTYIETVLESLSTGVVSLDEQDRVTTINAAALLMLRLAAAPAPGTSLAEITTPEDRAMLERVLQRARRTGRAAWQMELARGANSNGNGADGAGLPVALTATALGPHVGAARGVVLVIEDLSELLAAQRAAAWSEVARRMAHEIKNPLTPIQLSAERIARNFHRANDGDNGQQANGHDEQSGAQGNGHASTRTESVRQAEQARVGRVVDECTATITREVAGLKAMVDEFARFARLPHARLEAADLNEVVRQAITLYEDRLAGVRMDVHLARTLPVAMLDAEQLRRVFVNLIDNALEAMSEQAAAERRVTVATAHDSARGLLLVEIADTGHGIEQPDFPRLFQPYFSTRGRGTGLGLAIVQRIITEHGGRIRAEANRPRGAKFVVELPVTEETQRSEVRG